MTTASILCALGASSLACADGPKRANATAFEFSTALAALGVVTRSFRDGHRLVSLLRVLSTGLHIGNATYRKCFAGESTLLTRPRVFRHEQHASVVFEAIAPAAPKGNEAPLHCSAQRAAARAAARGGASGGG